MPGELLTCEGLDLHMIEAFIKCTPGSGQCLHWGLVRQRHSGSNCRRIEV
jgi:hypothetical protein